VPYKEKLNNVISIFQAEVMFFLICLLKTLASTKNC